MARDLLACQRDTTSFPLSSVPVGTTAGAVFLWGDLHGVKQLAFYQDWQWQQCRDAYYNKAGGLCEECLKRGIIRPGVIVHHKIPLTPENVNDPSIAYNFDNLELLCRDCHAKAHGRYRRYKLDAFGNVEIK